MFCTLKGAKPRGTPSASKASSPRCTLLKFRVVDLDFCGTEIRYIEKFVAIDFARGCAFVDGAIRGAVIGVVDDGHGILPASPAGDRSIFGCKNEGSRFAGSNQKISGAAVEHDARWSREGSRR